MKFKNKYREGKIKMIKLESITVDNFEECLRLRVNDSQSKYIASNAYSLAEAYALTNHKLYKSITYAIYNDNVMIGFIFVIYQPIDKDDLSDDEDVYYLARIMIDYKYQGKGYGKKALDELIKLLKTKLYGDAKTIVLSSNPNNQPAYSLFLSLGFKEMGINDDDGDNLLRLELD